MKMPDATLHARQHTAVVLASWAYGSQLSLPQPPRVDLLHQRPRVPRKAEAGHPPAGRNLAAEVRSDVRVRVPLQQLAHFGFLEEGVGDGVRIWSLEDSVVGCQTGLFDVGIWGKGIGCASESGWWEWGAVGGDGDGDDVGEVLDFDG